MDEEDKVEIALSRREGYRFEVGFPGTELDPLQMDEPAPLGGGEAPNASRFLAAAVADCLSASLLFCLQKAHLEVGEMQTRASARLGRNEKGRLRIAAIDVAIEVPGLADNPRLHRCTELFEEYCVVTASVRQGVAVNVTVTSDGVTVYGPD